MTAPSPTPTPSEGESLREAMPEALRAELMPDAENLAVALTDAVMADGFGFKGPYEEFVRIAEPLLLDALGAARRDGAQIANEASAQTLAQLQADLVTARVANRDLHRRAQKAEAFKARHRNSFNYVLNSTWRDRRARRQAEANLIALAKMYGEACGELQVLRYLLESTADEATIADFMLSDDAAECGFSVPIQTKEAGE
jgi:hypothetical protein